MEEISPWGANICSVSQEIPSLVCNRKRKSPPLRSNLSIQMDAVYIPMHLSPYSLRSTLIFISHLRLGPPDYLFPLLFSDKHLHIFRHSHTCYNIYFMKEKFTLSFWSIHWSKLIISPCLSSSAVTTCLHGSLKSAVVLQYLSVTPTSPLSVRRPIQCSLNCLSFGIGISMSCMKQAE
jgi:hypothetical protein